VSSRREQQQERVGGENSSRSEWEEPDTFSCGECGRKRLACCKQERVSSRREQQQERVGGENSSSRE